MKDASDFIVKNDLHGDYIKCPHRLSVSQYAVAGGFLIVIDETGTVEDTPDVRPFDNLRSWFNGWRRKR